MTSHAATAGYLCATFFIWDQWKIQHAAPFLNAAYSSGHVVGIQPLTRPETSPGMSGMDASLVSLPDALK
jgi:hypothetical protein